MKDRIILVIFFVCTATTFVHCQLAEECTAERNATCNLPDCRCSGTTTPGGLAVNNIPQLVFLTFDDAVTFSNFHLYKEIFTENRKNPNGHRITGTFFVSHEYTDYSMVHDLWRNGHEIALHSISHKSPTTYWANINESMWIEEIARQRSQIAYLAQIPEEDIKGMRAPFLQIGGDAMYRMLKDSGLQYDCSRPTKSYRDPGLWPYTNDYLSVQECQVHPCPVEKHEGVWTVPMIALMGKSHTPCPMVDMCQPAPETEKDTFDLLMKNFRVHYEGNRAPFGLHTHAPWINGPYPETMERKSGYERFLDEILTLGDTYIVSVTRGVEWVKAPQDLAEIKKFSHFQIGRNINFNCTKVYSCHYRSDQTSFLYGERYMPSCVTCPSMFPWVKNPYGESHP